MIRNILFDMGGVVFRQDTQEAFRRFRAAGIDPNFYMGAYGQKDFFLDLEMGRIGAEEFCRRMAQAAGRERISFSEAQRCWLGFILDVPVERLRHLLRLKQRYHLCLLSNTNPFVMAYTNSASFSLDAQPIAHYFHSLFLSYEMNVCKPSPAIFLNALATDGMRAEESIFVDDSAANIAAAQALGFHTLHVAANADWFAPLTRLCDCLSGAATAP